MRKSRRRRRRRTVFPEEEQATAETAQIQLGKEKKSTAVSLLLLLHLLAVHQEKKKKKLSLSNALQLRLHILSRPPLLLLLSLLLLLLTLQREKKRFLGSRASQQSVCLSETVKDRKQKKKKRKRLHCDSSRERKSTISVSERSLPFFFFSSSCSRLLLEPFPLFAHTPYESTIGTRIALSALIPVRTSLRANVCRCIHSCPRVSRHTFVDEDGETHVYVVLMISEAVSPFQAEEPVKEHAGRRIGLVCTYSPDVYMHMRTGESLSLPFSF